MDTDVVVDDDVGVVVGAGDDGVGVVAVGAVIDVDVEVDDEYYHQKHPLETCQMH